MKYNENFLAKRKKEVEKLLHFLQECKYSGSWDTKVNFNDVITVIAQSNYIIDELSKEIKRLETEKNTIKKSPEGNSNG